MSLRVASLLPAATELVCAVGARADLVGVSHECDYPEGVATLPVLTRARLGRPHASSGIDAEVRSLVEGALSIYEIDVERLEAARPDVIVTQDLCDVCAVSLDDVKAAVARCTRTDARVVTLHPTCLDDVFGDVLRVGAALGRATEAAGAAGALRARVESIGARAAKLPGRRRVLTLEWIEPVMVGGLWMPELIELAGGEPLVTTRGQHAPTLSPSELAALSPDVVLVKPCGFTLERTLEELDVLRGALPAGWRAVQEGRVYLADGNAFFNRPGPRIVESLELLAACVHPEAFEDFAALHRTSFIPLGDASARGRWNVPVVS